MFPVVGRLFAICTIAVLISFPVRSEPDRLPYPRALYHKVEFWKSIYTKYTTRQGVLHDSEDLSIVYEQVDLPPSGNQQIVNERRIKVREALFNILRKRGQNLTSFERSILSKFPKYASRSRLLQATENIRFQLGQADRFRSGVINSGKYMKDIERILKEEGAPDFLKYLPHVESSFQEKAMSKFGAAGLWQLMPETGRQFLRVDYSVDQRLDPWIATRAAARYLIQNYRRLKEWPLALTAYNHGAGGVERAVRTLGTTDIAEIAFQYSTRSFGFASRNFYAQFLAAVQVAQDYQKYFGPIELAKAYRYDEIKLPRAMYFREFSKNYRFKLSEFKELNPGLRKPVLDNRRPIPKGIIVRVPKDSRIDPLMVASLDKKVIKEAIETKPETQIEIKALESKKESPKPEAAVGTEISAKKTEEASKDLPKLEEMEKDSKYRVRDFVDGKAWIVVEINETISQIADWLKVPVAKLREWNGIEKRGQVRLGQKLLLKFESASVSEFELARQEYHSQIREDFFSQFQVDSFLDYTVLAGENLWSICFQKFDVPPWLLEEFNPGISISDLGAGTKLKIPVLKELEVPIVGEDKLSSQSN